MERKSKRYSIKADDSFRNRVTLTDHESGIETEYWCPSDGGYVRQIDDTHPGLLGQQVCYGLSTRGDTLHCHDPKNLVRIIRREARKYYRDCEGPEDYA